MKKFLSVFYIRDVFDSLGNLKMSHTATGCVYDGRRRSLLDRVQLKWPPNCSARYLADSGISGSINDGVALVVSLC